MLPNCLLSGSCPSVLSRSWRRGRRVIFSSSAISGLPLARNTGAGGADAGWERSPASLGLFGPLMPLSSFVSARPQVWRGPERCPRGTPAPTQGTLQPQEDGQVLGTQQGPVKMSGTRARKHPPARTSVGSKIQKEKNLKITMNKCVRKCLYSAELHQLY